jgi:hypothetical protein
LRSLAAIDSGFGWMVFVHLAGLSFWKKLMGLTVHFKLAAPPDTNATRARELVRAMRRRAQGFKQRGRVDDVLPIGEDEEALRWAAQYKSVPHPRMPGC